MPLPLSSLTRSSSPFLPSSLSSATVAPLSPTSSLFALSSAWSSLTKRQRRSPLLSWLLLRTFFFKGYGDYLVLLRIRIAFLGVPSPPSPSVEPLQGLRIPETCVPPPPLLSVAVAMDIIVIVVVVPPPPLPNALPPSSSYSSMAGMVAPTDRCCVREV